MTYLQAEMATWKVLRERLKAMFPDMDDADLIDTLDGETSVREILVSMLRKADDDAMMVTGIAERKKELAAREARLKARVDRVRSAVLLAMQESGMRKIEEPDFTASISRKAPGLVITDEDAVPAEYVELKRVIKRADLKAALKEGTDVNGASLDNGGFGLTVRRA